ncbi:unnamed protein product, partial [Brassica oleracea var. botrytis]
YGFDSYQTIKFGHGFSVRFRITLTSSRVEWTTKEMNRELELIGTQADVVSSCLIAEIGNASCPTYDQERLELKLAGNRLQTGIGITMVTCLEGGQRFDNCKFEFVVN